MNFRRSIEPSTIFDECRAAGMVGLLFAAAVVLGGCGGSGPDKCSDVVCAYGVCSPESGECVNATTCRQVASSTPTPDASATDAGSAAAENQSQCLPGYRCVSGECEPSETCGENAPCERGTCEDGVCVNESDCRERSQCIDGWFCDAQTNSCTEDACAETSCERGVCNRVSGECVNRDTCPSSEDRPPACLEGYTCVDGSCTENEEICSRLECERGVCSPGDGKCVNRDDCSGNEDCVEGFFCAEDGTCLENECLDGEACMKGVCDPESGECVNPESCSSPRDCLPMNVCVEVEGEPTCVQRSKACRESGCPGQQRCAYDADALSAACRESSPCRNAIDCKSERVCRAGACSNPSKCDADDLEPNDRADEATSYSDRSRGGRIRASICRDDTDVYTFDTSSTTIASGEMKIQLSFRPPDVGVGTLSMDVTDPEGDTVASVTSDRDRPGEISITESVGPGDRGTYEIVVSDTGDVTTAGVDYTLFADVVGQTVARHCENAETLDNQGASGDTMSGASVGLDATCVQDGGSVGEDVYEFSVADKSLVEIGVAPAESSDDLAVSLRRSCESEGSEMACSDRAGEGEREQISQTVDPGTYYAVVQGAGPDVSSGGPYDISFSTTSVTCTQADNACVGQQAKICNEQGTGFGRVNCSNGCDRLRGVCRRPVGDACYETKDASSGLSSETVNWNKLKDDLNPGVRSCVSADMDGPDAVYEVRVPAGHAVSAELSSVLGDRAALYVLGSCNHGAGACREGTSGGSRVVDLQYANNSMSSETVFVVADSVAGTQGRSSLDLSVDEIICTPGNKQCKSGNVHTCNAAGTALNQSRRCGGGCANGICRGESCSAPIDATGGGSWTLTFGNFSNDYELQRRHCAHGDLDAPDVVFETVVQSDQVLEATVDPRFQRQDPAVYVVTDCSSTSSHAKTCLNGESSSRGTETVLADGPDSGSETYFVVVDSDNRPLSDWQVDINLRQTSCKLGETSCAGSDTLQYCGAFGLKEKTYSCGGSQGGCVTSSGRARCKNPTGDQCVDAVPVASGETKSADFDGTEHLEMPRGRSGECYFSHATDGPEEYYAVDLEKDDLLRADLKTTHSDAELFVMGSCRRENSCLATAPQSGGSEVTYFAEKKERVYIVVDTSDGSGDPATYDLEVDVESDKACNPEATRCLAGGSRVGICDGSASSFSPEFGCQNGCSSGACTFKQSAINGCRSAPKVGDGTVVTGTYEGLNNDVNLPGNSCNGEESDGSDASWKVELQPGEVLHATLDALGRDEPLLYALENCNQPASSCVAGTQDAGGRGGRAEIFHRAKKAQTVTVVADSTTPSADEPFQLAIRVENIQCRPGARRCAQNGVSLEYCSNVGFWKTISCNGGCTAGRCNNPSGDVCADAIPLRSGDTVDSSWSGSDSIRLTSGRTGGCFLDGGDETSGPEDIYSVRLRKGDLLRAKLETKVGSAQLMIFDNCRSNDSCRANAIEGGETTQFHYATSPGPVFVAVDATESNPSGSYKLSVDIEPNRTCAAGDTMCVSQNTVGICNADGTSFEGRYNCPTGCVDGACKPDSRTDACASAPSAGGGVASYHNYANLTDDVDISSSAPCVSDDGHGPEAIYSVDVAAGEILHAESISRGGEQPLVYFVRDCSKPDSTCLAGGLTEDHRSEATFSPDKAMTVYVVADSTSNGYDQPFEVRIETFQPECQTPTRTCASNGETLNYCRPPGVRNQFDCPNSCVAGKGRCKDQNGEVCPLAVDASGGGSFTFDASTFEDDYDLSARSSCTGDDTPGADRVHRVQLKKDEVLDATLTPQRSGDNPSLYATTGCGSASTVAKSCVAGADAKGNGDAETIRVAPLSTQKQTYYVVADADDSSDDEGKWTLDMNVQTQTCQPGDPLTCTGGGSDLEYCSLYGTKRKTLSCQGGCNGGSCANPKGDVCADAKVVSSPPMSSSPNIGTYTDFVDMKSSSCLGEDSPGNDVFYRVSAQGGETIEVDVTPTSSDGDPMIVVGRDCARMVRSGGATCVAGVNDRSDGGPESLSYTVPGGEGGEYWVVVDAQLQLDSKGSFDTTINVK